MTIYPGADGAYELYEDDGKTFAPERRLDCGWRWRGTTRGGDSSLAPCARLAHAGAADAHFEVRVAGSQYNDRQ